MYDQSSLCSIPFDIRWARNLRWQRSLVRSWGFQYSNWLFFVSKPTISRWIRLTDHSNMQICRASCSHLSISISRECIDLQLFGIMTDCISQKWSRIWTSQQMMLLSGYAIASIFYITSMLTRVTGWNHICCLLLLTMSHGDSMGTSIRLLWTKENNSIWVDMYNVGLSGIWILKVTHLGDCISLACWS